VRLPAAGQVVVKPSIGAGSVGAQRYADRTAAMAHAAALQAQGRGVLVQPYDDRIERAGEAALLPAEGRHAELDATGTYAVESLAPAEPDFEVWDVGFAALDAAAGQLN